MEVLIDNRQSRHKISPKTIKHTVQVILDALDCPESEISILIVDDPQTSELNQQYLNREGPTNVIAFAMREGAYADISPQLLGDVVISIETAYREGQEAGIDPLKRFDQLLVHGILHLFGFDHETDESDAAKMEEMSTKLLNLIDT
jgi:probable rRNA maturation factor